MQFNWIDWIIIAILVFHAYEGWRAGVFYLLTDFLAFTGSLIFAVWLNQPAGNFLADKFGIPEAWKLVVGYILVGLAAHFIISEITNIFLAKCSKDFLHSKLSNWFGAFVSMVNGFLIVAFFLLVVMILPIRGTIKRDINASKIGSFIVGVAEKYGGPVKSVVQEARSQAVKFFTVSPGSKESMILNVAPKVADLRVDPALEQAMVMLVNGERKKMGIAELTVDSKITEVARAHSRDMFLRKYFSHYNPEGQDIGDWYRAAGIVASGIGENLAYAPDLETAHEGLMNSPEHKKNILEPLFHRIGIGIISTESYGIMITQNFAD
jgi:uncharacterized protein YkwD